MKSLNIYLNESSTLSQLGLSNELISSLHTSTVKNSKVKFTEIKKSAKEVKDALRFSDVLAVKDNDSVVMIKSSDDNQVLVTEYENGAKIGSMTLKKTELTKFLKVYKKLYVLDNNFSGLKRSANLNDSSKIVSANFDKILIKIIEEKRAVIIKELNDELTSGKYTYRFATNQIGNPTINKVHKIGELNILIEDIKYSPLAVGKIIGVPEFDVDAYRKGIAQYKNK